MNTYTVVTHNGFDYWLDANGILSYKPEGSYFWERCFYTNIPQVVKEKLNISKCQHKVLLGYTIEVIWS